MGRGKESETAIQILKEHFGDEYKHICQAIEIHPKITLNQVIKKCQDVLTSDQVIKGVSTLIKFNFIKQTEGKKGEIGLKYNSTKVLNQLYVSHYLTAVFNNFGTFGLFIIEILLKNGCISIEEMVQQLQIKLDIDSEAIDSISQTWSDLIQANIVNKMQGYSDLDSKYQPKDIPDIREYFAIEAEEPGLKRRHENSLVYIKANLKVLRNLVLKEMLIKYVTNHTNENCGIITRFLLEVKGTEELDVPVTIDQLTSSIPKDVLSEDRIVSCLNALCDINFKFVKMIFSGPKEAYLIQTNFILTKLTEEVVGMFVDHRYGEDGRRIYNCLRRHPGIEQTELSNRTLIPVRTSNAVFYRLREDGIVDWKKISTTADCDSLLSKFPLFTNLKDCSSSIYQFCCDVIQKLIEKRIEIATDINQKLFYKLKLMNKCPEFDSVTELLRYVKNNPNSVECFTKGEKDRYKNYNFAIAQLDFSQVNVSEIMIVMKYYQKFKSSPT